MTGDETREQEVGEKLADALMQHAMTTAKESGLRPRSVLRAASERLEHHLRAVDVDWDAWASRIDVRGDEGGKRKN